MYKKLKYGAGHTYDTEKENDWLIQHDHMISWESLQDFAGTDACLRSCCSYEALHVESVLALSLHNNILDIDFYVSLVFFWQIIPQDSQG